MAIPAFTFKSTPSPLTKDNLPLTIYENTFLAYSTDFFQQLLDLNTPHYYYSTSKEIDQDFEHFCQTHNMTFMDFKTHPLHSLAMSIRDKIQFLHPSEFAQAQTEQWNGKGICFSRFQLKFIVATAKTVLQAYQEIGKQVMTAKAM